jgi:hypothetical protein
MTDNEREFYRRLIAAFPECQIWPQVPNLAMLRPDAKDGSRALWRGFRMISNTRVDWVLLRDLQILAIIELDDRTHDARKDAKRDQILAFCGYKVVPFNSRRRPTQLRSRFVEQCRTQRLEEIGLNTGASVRNVSHMLQSPSFEMTILPQAGSRSDSGFNPSKPSI